MKRSAILGVGLLALCLASGVGPGWAQKDKDPGKETKGDAGLKRLTADGLKTLLDAMGYEDMTDSKNADGYLVGVNLKVKGATWDYTYSVSPSISKENIIIQVNLLPIPKPETIPSKSLLALMNKTLITFPGFFAFDEKNSQFNYRVIIPNQNVVARTLRPHIDRVLPTLESTEIHWNPKKWS